MQKFGLIGGTSWYSTIDYYGGINGAINAAFGNNTNPPLLVTTLNQKAIHDLQKANDWDGVAELITTAAHDLQHIKVAGVALCANTPHRVYDQIQASLSVPVLHIGDAIGTAIKKKGWKNVALLGTTYVMEGDFIRGRLCDKFDITTLVPDEDDRKQIQKYLYEEMSHGQFTEQAKLYFSNLIDGLKQRGAEAVILGCTEFPILLRDRDVCLPKIDSTECHINDIVEFIMADEEIG